MPSDVRQKSFSSGEISPRLYGRTDLPAYGDGLRRCRNMLAMAEGPVRNRPGTIHRTEVKDSSKKVRLTYFVNTAGTVFLLEWGDLYVRFRYFSTYALVSANPAEYEKATPYTEAQLPRLRMSQKGNVLVVSNPSHNWRSITWLSDTNWDVQAARREEADLPLVTPSASGGDLVGDADHPLRDWVWAIAAYDQKTGIEGYGGLAGFTDTHSVALYPDRPHVDVTGTNFSPGAIPPTHHIYYRGRNGTFGFVGIAPVVAGVSAFKDDGVDPDFTRQPPTEYTPFDAANKYPALVCFFEGRKVFARTNSNPSGLWGSKVEHCDNNDIYVPVADDNPLQFTLASKNMEEIRAIIPARNLVVLTNNAEWVVNGAGDQPITPLTFSARPHSRHGCSWTEPVELGSTIIFVQERGSIVRAVSFSSEAQGIVDQNVSLMSQHLIDGRTLDYLAASGAPNNVMWAVRSDGILLGLTISLEPNAIAWHWHDTDGLFESVCSVPNGYEDAVLVVVKRTINGVTKRYIEQIATRNVDHVDEFIFLDCSKTVQSGIGNITGLDHLEAKQVHVLLDGATLGPFTVTGGAINLGLTAEGAWGAATTYAAGLYVTHLGQTYLSLQALDADGEPIPNLNKDPTVETTFWKVATAHIGLKYTAEIELLDLPPQKSNVKSVRKVSVEVEASRGLWVGEDFDHLAEWKQREVADGYGTIPLFTGVVPVNIKSSWNLGGRAVLRQEDPLPITILGVTREVELGGS